VMPCKVISYFGRFRQRKWQMLSNSIGGTASPP
jgi:hypothetical protein